MHSGRGFSVPGTGGLPLDRTTAGTGQNSNDLDQETDVTTQEYARMTTLVTEEGLFPRPLGVAVPRNGANVAEILVVDDSKVMRDMIVACLRPRADFAFTHASSGLEAIERLSLKRFDLVVLDLNMPDIGGIEVIEFVRGQDALRELPIIIVTTRGDDASRAKSLQAGASRFMTKPFTPDAILREVGDLVPKQATT